MGTENLDGERKSANESGEAKMEKNSNSSLRNGGGRQGADGTNVAAEVAALALPPRQSSSMQETSSTRVSWGPFKELSAAQIDALDQTFLASNACKAQDLPWSDVQ